MSINRPILTVRDHQGAARPDRNSVSAPPRWRVVADCEPSLLQPDAPDWGRLDEESRATLVKTNPARQVWRVELPDRAVFAKLFFDRGLGDSVRSLLRRLPERREWRAGRYAAEFGIGCVRYLAYLQPAGRPTRLRAVLISQAAPNAVPLTDEWERVASIPDESTRLTQVDHLSVLVARLTAAAHQKQFLHRDTHPQNILICRDEGRAPVEAVYTDPHRARIGRRVSDRRAAAHLAELQQWFRTRASVEQRLRFLETYLALRYEGAQAYEPGADARARLRAWARRVERASRRQAARLHAQRDRRVLRQNRFFGQAPLGRGWIGWFTLRFRRRDLQPRPSQPDRSLPEWIDWVRKQLPDLDDATACQTAANRLGLTMVRLVAQTTGARLSWTLRGSPGRRAFREGHARRNRDLPTASPIAFFERRSWGCVVETVLLLESQEGGAR
jgi:hypothetical protein